MRLRTALLPIALVAATPGAAQLDGNRDEAQVPA